MQIRVDKGLCFLNVGEKTSTWVRNNPGKAFADRKWENSLQYGFISAGQGRNWSEQLDKLAIGDVVIAFITKYGYVGIGKISGTAVPINEFYFDGKLLKELPLHKTNIFLNESDLNKREWLVRVKWFEGKTVPRDRAYWERRKPKLFATQHVCASLLNQGPTIDFIQSCFGVQFIY